MPFLEMGKTGGRAGFECVYGGGEIKISAYDTLRLRCLLNAQV